MLTQFLNCIKCFFDIQPLFIDQTISIHKIYDITAIYPNDVCAKFELITKKRDRWKILIKAYKCLSDPPICIIIKDKDKLIIDYVL